MEKTEVEINSKGIRRKSSSSEEYRQRRRAKNNKREEKHSSFYDSMMIRIVLCILIGGVGSIIFGSNSEKAENLKSELNQVLSENISFDDLKDIGKNIKVIKDKGFDKISSESDIEIENDYIEEMNSQEDFYENQKK